MKTDEYNELFLRYDDYTIRFSAIVWKMCVTVNGGSDREVENHDDETKSINPLKK